jgi:hypothetical protein
MAPDIINSTLATMEDGPTCCNTATTARTLESGSGSKMKVSARVAPDKQHKSTAIHYRLTRRIKNASIRFYRKLSTKLQGKKPVINLALSNPCDVRGRPTSV